VAMPLEELGSLSRLVSTSGLAGRVSGSRTGRAESRDDATWR
jgi:hypothetical protein